MMSRRGATNLVICDINEKLLQDTVQELRAGEGCTVHYYTCDVTSVESVGKMAASIQVCVERQNNQEGVDKVFLETVTSSGKYFENLR